MSCLERTGGEEFEERFIEIGKGMERTYALVFGGLAHPRPLLHRYGGKKQSRTEEGGDGLDKYILTAIMWIIWDI